MRVSALRIAVVCLLLTVAAVSMTTVLRAGSTEVVLTYGHSVPITKLSPDRGTYLQFASGYEAAILLYDELVNFDEQLNPLPGLATSWEVSPDGKRWTLELREGVKFHNGDPFDAEVACWNIARWMDSDIYPTDRSLRDPIAGCKVVSPYVIEVAMKEPFSSFVRSLMFPGAAITTPTVYEENGHEWYATHPVGTGPFKVEEFDVGKRLVLTANDQYWGGKPTVDRIVFEYLPESYSRVAALKAGEVDVIDKVPPHMARELEAYPDFRVEGVPSTRLMKLFAYLLHEPLDDVGVRRALSLAVPRTAIAENLLMGYSIPADSHLASAMSGHVGVGTVERDLEEADRLLTAAGWADTDGDGIRDKDGRPLELTLVTPEGFFDMDVQVSEVIAGALQEVGVKVDIHKVEVGTYWADLRLKPSNCYWDLILFGYLDPIGDPYMGLDAMYRSKVEDPTADVKPVEWNISRYDNPQVEALLSELRRTFDTAQRMEIVADIQQILWEDMPSIPLYTDAFLAAAKKEVKGPLYWASGFLILSKASKEGGR
jgi:ABC-type transport system substrate-binding protein